PAPSATCTPSSSGPRYTICSHIWCTRASVMLLSRVALTTPAIPHMVLIYPFELDPLELDSFEVDPSSLSFRGHRNRTGLLRRPPHVRKAFEAIIAVVSGIPLAAVASGEQDVRHFTRGNKVQRFLSVGRAADQCRKKVAEAVAYHGVFLARVHAMAMQFNEQPVGTSYHADLRTLPEGEPVHGRGFGSGDCAIVESGPGGTQGTLEVGYERTLHDQRKRRGHSPCDQVMPLAVRRCLIDRKSAFVYGINFFDLCRIPEGARQGQVGVAAGLGQNLHFRIDAAEAPGGGVREREISVHKRVTGTSGTFFQGQAIMTKGQPVAKFREQQASIFGGVGVPNTMVQMDLDFSPTGVAVIGEHLEQALVILFGRIEVSVVKRAAIVVAPAVHDFGIFANPELQPALLLGARSALLAVFRDNAWFEMIGQSKDQVHRAVGSRIQRAPGCGRQDLSCVGDLVF